MSDGVIAQSRERLLRYRDHVENAAVRSKYRSVSFVEPDVASPDHAMRKCPNYRVLVLSLDGRITGTAELAAQDDDEALHATAAIAGEHAADLWDGLRFIEHFEQT